MIYSHLDCERTDSAELMTGDVHLLVGGFHPSEKYWIYISQNGNLPQIWVKIKNMLNHLVMIGDAHFFSDLGELSKKIAQTTGSHHV